MARAKGIAEENPGGRLATKTSQYASPSISIAWCINGRQAEVSRTSAFICALPNTCGKPVLTLVALMAPREGSMGEVDQHRIAISSV
jgi:hypothetical protein